MIIIYDVEALQQLQNVKGYNKQRIMETAYWILSKKVITTLEASSLNLFDNRYSSDR